jgi:hypothetical protein
MDPNPLIAKAQRVLRRRKEQVVAEGGIGADVDPVLLVTQGSMAIGAYELPDDTAEVQATMAAAIILSDADTAYVMGDVYVSLTPFDGPDWLLAQRFGAGDPNVVEAMSVIIVSRVGWKAVAFDLYRYRGNRIEWLPFPGQIYADDGDAIMAEIVALFGQQARRRGPALVTHGAGLHLLGSQLYPDETTLVAFALEAGCACGSGQPYHLCCQIRN